MTEFDDEDEAIRHRQRLAVRAGGRACGRATSTGPTGIARRLRAGTVWVNTFDTADITVPVRRASSSPGSGATSRSTRSTATPSSRRPGSTCRGREGTVVTETRVPRRPRCRRPSAAVDGGHGAAGERSRLPQQRPWAQPRMRYAPTEVVSADELESIHLALPAGPRRDRHGLPRPRGPRACFGRPARASSPAQRARPLRPGDGPRADPDGAVVVHAARPNPEHDLRSSAATGWRSGRWRSPPNVADLDRGRRVGNRADYQNLIRLCQMLETSTSSSGYPVEPIDIHASIRHLDAIDDLLTLDRQADPRLQPRPAAQSRRPRDGPDRPGHRRRDARPRAVGLHRHQLELAAAPRHADAPGDRSSSRRATRSS